MVNLQVPPRLPATGRSRPLAGLLALLRVPEDVLDVVTDRLGGTGIRGTDVRRLTEVGDDKGDAIADADRTEQPVPTGRELEPALGDAVRGIGADPAGRDRAAIESMPRSRACRTAAPRPSMLT
jgi:hypothetical protein